MTITRQQLQDLEAEINDVLEEDCAEVSFSFHAAYDRLNDARNNPAISIPELESVFKEFIRLHLQTMLSLNEGDSFTIKCNKSNLNFPCGISHDLRIGKIWVIQNVVTVMRKADFKSKDDLVLEVN